jgi:hypothetical protein
MIHCRFKSKFNINQGNSKLEVKKKRNMQGIGKNKNKRFNGTGQVYFLPKSLFFASYIIR